MNPVIMANPAAPQYSHLFVVLMGMGVVFFGLICIIFLTWLMGVCMKNRKGAVTTTTAAPAAPAAPAPAISPEVLAVITAVIADQPGGSANNIVSIKKL